ncbi:MAG: MFS transporter [Thermotogae bacterium]|nr:MAG: MFS transporter [Thermotogota bacterium]
MGWKKNLALIALGRLVSILGSSIQAVAIPLLVLDLTHSGSIMAKMALFYMIPRIIIMPFAGLIGDRVNRKHLMVWMDYLRGILVIILAYIAYKDLLSIRILYLSQVFMAIMDNLFMIPTGAMIPDIVPKEQLTRANSIMGMINFIPQLIGPAAGGVLYGFYGIKIIFLINGLSFLISGFSEMFIEYHQSALKGALTLKKVVSEIKEGLMFVWSHSILRMIVLGAMTINVFLSPMFQVLYPYTLREVVKFSPQQFGYLESIFIVGALMGNALLATFFAKRDVSKIMKGSLVFVLFLVPIFGVLTLPGTLSRFNTWEMFMFFSVLLVLMGFLVQFVDVPIEVIFQRETPTEIRGRAFSILMLMAQGTMPIGIAMYGALLDMMAIHKIYFLGGGILTVIGILLIAFFPDIPAPEEESSSQ